MIVSKLTIRTSQQVKLLLKLSINNNEQVNDFCIIATNITENI